MMLSEMFALAVQQDLNGILEYASFVRENFHCPIISNISDYIMAPGYFYDTNYHVTDRGVIEHTARLIQDLQNYIGDGSLIDIEIPAPPIAQNAGFSGEPTGEPRDPNAMPLPEGRNSANVNGLLPPPPMGFPAFPGTDPVPADTETAPETAETVTEAEPEPTPVPTPEPVGSSKDAAYLTYEAFSEGLMVNGVTDEGKTLTELEIPWLIDGQKVIAIDQDTFDGCDALQTLYIQPNVSRIMQGAFDGAPRLTAIHIENDAGANILIPGTGLFDNVPSRLKVYVPKSAYGVFLADYFWGNYNDRLVPESN